MTLKASELILNDDGSVYHLQLKPENIANTIIFVGDQDRVTEISNYFDSIEFTTQKREFKTVTGYYKGEKLSVISTGIGPDNIDIVLNELDALVNIDLSTRKIKKQITSLNIIRIGTSGALQKDILVNSFLVSEYALDVNGMLQSYKTAKISYPEIENSFIEHVNWSSSKAHPTLIKSSNILYKKFVSKQTVSGITATAGGFYGAQGRVLRLPLQDEKINEKITTFSFEGMRITNLEMETSAIYGLSRLLGHHAISLNAIIANRENGTFSENYKKVVKNLIEYTLQKIVE